MNRKPKNGNRIDMLHVLLTAEKPLTVKEIQERMSEPLDRKTIRWNMDMFAKCGFKTKVEFIGHKNYYTVDI